MSEGCRILVAAIGAFLVVMCAVPVIAPDDLGINDVPVVVGLYRKARKWWAR